MTIDTLQRRFNSLSAVDELHLRDQDFVTAEWGKEELEEIALLGLIHLAMHPAQAQLDYMFSLGVSTVASEVIGDDILPEWGKIELEEKCSLPAVLILGPIHLSLHPAQAQLD